MHTHSSISRTCTAVASSCSAARFLLVVLILAADEATRCWVAAAALAASDPELTAAAAAPLAAARAGLPARLRLVAEHMVSVASWPGWERVLVEFIEPDPVGLCYFECAFENRQPLLAPGAHRQF